jgi:hypothetical protein
MKTTAKRAPKTGAQPLDDIQQSLAVLREIRDDPRASRIARASAARQLIAHAEKAIDSNNVTIKPAARAEAKRARHAEETNRMAIEMMNGIRH